VTGRGLRVEYGRGKVDGWMIPGLLVDGREYFPIALAYGRVEIQFQHMSRVPFNDHALRREFLDRLNAIDGVALNG
jgi:hypothetical protein